MRLQMEWAVSGSVATALVVGALAIEVFGVARPSSSAALAASDPLHPELVSIPPGAYVMGDIGWPHTPLHEVTVPGFAIGRHEVTRGEYLRFVASIGGRVPPGPPDLDLRLPISGVTWFEAAAYAAWLTSRTGQPYRLPTEVEWERAARAGSEQNLYEWGDEDPHRAPWRGNVADVTAKGHYHPRTDPVFFPLAFRGYDDGFADLAPVGSFAPNGFGLFDVTGNVSEWCSDEFGDMTMPMTGGLLRAVRGASFLSLEESLLRVGRRLAIEPETRNIGIGFRLAMDRSANSIRRP